MRGLQEYRFGLYLATLCLVLFGSLIFPEPAFQAWISPLFLTLNLAAGFVLIAMRKKALWLYTGLFAVGMGFYLLRWAASAPVVDGLELWRFGFYALFYILVTVEIILQVWRVKHVNRKVILGLICGYLSLGLVSFFLVMGVEIAQPESFSGLPEGGSISERSESLLYFAYITLMTIGYGDMAPLQPTAQKAAMLIGLIGQFYLVIITAVVVEKYIAAKREGTSGTG